MFWCLGLGVTGCRSTQSVSSTSTTDSSDSVKVKTEVRKDSTSVKETAEVKTIPGSAADVKLTKGMLDSAIAAARSIPQGAPKIVYLTDPRLQTRISVLIDSLGNSILRCSDKDETYTQVTRELTRIIEQQKTELEKIRKESATSSTEKSVVQKGFFQEIWDAAKWILIVLAICIVGSLFFWIKSKLSLR